MTTEAWWGLPPGCSHFRLDAPGNLLLCGEYAITEPGGEGIWLATEAINGRRAWLTCRPAPVFCLQMVWPNGGERWPSGTSQPMPALLSAVAEGLDSLSLVGRFGGAFQAPQSWLGNWEITIDTSAFFAANGRKLGLGSSAVACLLLGAALLHLHSASLPSPARQRLWAELAGWTVANHRRFQGGRGSGYDVLCSFHGGLGHFTGGETPWGERLGKPLEASFSRFRLLAGPAAIRTVSAIDAWTTWKTGHPCQAASYLAACRRNARALAATPLSDPLPILEQARQDGIGLGEAIGVTANLPPGLTDGFAKALGAGNETILCLEAGGDFRLASEGLRGRAISHQTQARGKLLLFGEHAALYGWPAIGTPLNAACTICFCPHPAGPKVDLAADQPTDRLFPDLDPVLAIQASQVLDRALAAFGELGLPPGQFWITSQVPEGSGFGSSAAFAAALARLVWQLAKTRERPLQPEFAGSDEAESLWKLANHLDGFFHGRASGIDTGLALMERPQVFLPNPDSPGELNRRQLVSGAQHSEIWLVHAALPRSGNTRDLVAGVRQGLESGIPRFVHGIAELGHLSQQAIQLLEAGGGADDLGDLANRAQALLGNLGLSNGELEAALTLGRAAGASGGKLSGAGGGGAFYLCAASQSIACRVVAALQASQLPFRSPPGILALGR